MVTSVTSLTGNGLKDWWIQRATAFYFLIYTVFLFGFIVSHPDLNFLQWQNLFNNIGFKVATMIALVALTLHTWIGIWTVLTDYVTSSAIRFSLQLAVMLFLLAQFIYGFLIIWGQ